MKANWRDAAVLKAEIQKMQDALGRGDLRAAIELADCDVLEALCDAYLYPKCLGCGMEQCECDEYE